MKKEIVTISKVYHSRTFPRFMVKSLEVVETGIIMMILQVSASPVTIAHVKKYGVLPAYNDSVYRLWIEDSAK